MDAERLNTDGTGAAAAPGAGASGGASATEARLAAEHAARASYGRLVAPGRFELEAAIQAVHLERRRTGTTDWAALRQLYSALVTVAPSLGSHVALAAVIGRTDGADAGLAALPPDGEHLQAWWATRAHLLARAGRAAEASVAYERAIELTDDAAVREYLAGRLSTLAPE